MLPNRFTTVPIPTDWSGKEAKAVLDFLEEVCQAIWYVYEQSITEAQIQQDLLDDVAGEQDEIPF